MPTVADRIRPRVVLAASAAGVLIACTGVPAQSSSDDEDGVWPSGTVEMLVGYAAGGSSDLVSRAVARGLSADLDGDFRVTNREGDNGAKAAAQLAAAPANGSVISIQNASLYTITPLAVSPESVVDIADVDVVHGISSDNYVLVANHASGFRTFADMKAADRTIRYGTAGVGTGAQLAGALLMHGADLPSQAVPFGSGAPNLAAVLAGEVDVAITQIGEAIENIESGKLVPLMVFSPQRISFLPDVPTVQEEGHDISVAQYRFMTVPRGTPKVITENLVEALKATFGSDAYRQFNELNSLTPMEIPGDQVLAKLEADKRRYAELVAQNGIDLHDAG